jgi:hypothetical protein
MKHPPQPLFHAEDEAAPEKTTSKTKAIRCVRARRRRKGGFTCATLPDGSLKPNNCACGRKLFARKAIKKGAAKPERTFLGKKSTCVSQRLDARKWRRKARRTKGNVSSVGPAQPKRKLRPIYTPEKTFFRATVTVSAVRILVACSLTSSSPALLSL